MIFDVTVGVDIFLLWLVIYLWMDLSRLKFIEVATGEMNEFIARDMIERPVNVYLQDEPPPVLKPLTVRGKRNVPK